MKFHLNNRVVDVPAGAEEHALVDFIRDTVGLTGTKFGCGEGLCGACTIHLDGEAVRSCQTSVAEVEGRHVTSIEGLAATAGSGDLHPVQEAWMEEAVPQCGYCQAGQIMNAAALLARVPDPSDEEIKSEMSGNLCRCGTYTRIHKAIVRTARENKNA